MFDISLLLNGQKIQPHSGRVTVRIPIPKNFDRSNLALYYIADNGAKTQLQFNVDGDYLVFTTDHFSCYAIADVSSSAKNTSPQTGEAPLTMYFIVGAAAAFAAIILLSKRKTVQKQK